VGVIIQTHTWPVRIRDLQGEDKLNPPTVILYYKTTDYGYFFAMDRPTEMVLIFLFGRILFNF
jgi:hypothetical protein